MADINQTTYLEIPALRVNQPLGDFYVVKLRAQDLLDISFSEPMEYVDDSGNVKGSQRPQDDKRLKEIAKYIDSVEMAFPNSIILAANYTKSGAIIKDESERWKIIENKECDTYKIVIPKKIQLAAIIDGQHRLKAFRFVTKKERFDDLQLVCSLYFDLPNSYQAFLFATINSNQKKVNRSLALEQFGYNVDDEPEKAWTPEKFSVFLSRKLNIDNDSPFYKHIKVAPLHPENLFPNSLQNEWIVSTATIVDGIDSLISNNIKRDRIEMQQRSLLTGRSRDMLKKYTTDKSPLRNLFLNGNDQDIYNIIVSFFKAANTNLWTAANNSSYIIKTVGIQALFDILKIILRENSSSLLSSINFGSYLLKASKIDFSDKFFQASGIGKSRIKNAIGIASGLVPKNKIKKNDVQFYDDVLSGKDTNQAEEKSVWEEASENAVMNLLDNAKWNYESLKSVSLYLNDDFEKPVIFKTKAELIKKLVEVADESFSSSLPDDSDIADQEKEKFDAEDLVNSYLSDYDDNLKRLGWNK